MKRIVIETSESKKTALENVLKKQGITLTDWFHEKLDEISEEPRIEYKKMTCDIKELSEIDDSTKTLQLLMQRDWAFTDSDTSYLSHSLHPYPAKYIPQIPNSLIRMLSLPGEVVWDPFGGSGTTALEALLLKRQAISSDVNQISQIIGRAKCSTFNKEEEILLLNFYEKVRLLTGDYQSFEDYFTKNKAEIGKEVPIIPNKDKWFQLSVWNELSYLKWSILKFENERLRNYLLAILSKIIIRVSYQDSETRYVSKPKDLERGVVFKIYSNELFLAIPKNKNLASLLGFREALFFTQDLRHKCNLEKNSVDLIITSPPYPNATDYHLYHRFRLYWLGFDPVALGKSEIGSHLRHQKEGNGIDKYMEEMRMCLSNLFEVLRHGRYAALIIGSANFEGNDYDTAELVSKVAESIGFEKVGIILRDVHETKRSFISAARRLREEKILLLRKQSKDHLFILNKPAYKLWPYEEELCSLEIQNLLGNKIIKNSKSTIKVRINSMKVDLLRRLTFIRSFESDDYSNELTRQAVIENGDSLTNISKRKDPKYATHGIHAYKGKFYPQLARCLFNLAKVNPGSSILDPFCGSGTVLLEGYLNGFNAVGFDLNPIAIKIANAKTGILKLDPVIVDKLISLLITEVENAQPTIEYSKTFQKESIPELESWFPKKVLEKLASIINKINEIPNIIVKEFLEVCLSSIIRDISQQDPQDLRIRRRKEEIEDAPVFDLYLGKLKEQKTRLRHFAERSHKISETFGTTMVIAGDSRELLSYNNPILQEGIDCVITSPPYATALPYIDTDRLSILLLLSMSSRERQSLEGSLVGAREINLMNKNEIEERIKNYQFEGILSNSAIETIKTVNKLNSKSSNIGFRKKNMASLIYRYYKDMSLIASNLDKVVKKDASLFFVIGDNKTFAGDNEEEIVIESGIALIEIGKSLGWTHFKTIPITVTQENRRHNKNSILKNDIIWFKK